jgi:hypothetical protein
MIEMYQLAASQHSAYYLLEIVFQVLLLLLHDRKGHKHTGLEGNSEELAGGCQHGLEHGQTFATKDWPV